MFDGGVAGGGGDIGDDMVSDNDNIFGCVVDGGGDMSGGEAVRGGDIGDDMMSDNDNILSGVVDEGGDTCGGATGGGVASGSLPDVRGTIFDIQRFSIHDGPGIRTNVFFKGCPLNCLWCHNPESIEKGREIAYYPAKCVACGACAAVCPRGRHAVSPLKAETAGHIYNRENCDRCGACAKACVFGALSVIGREITAGEALYEVKKDLIFYENSSGGMTLTGGEPFYQPEFSLALLRLAKADGIHTCVETCGAVPFGVLDEAAPYTDIFLYDIKETSPEKHKAATGAANGLIFANLEKLDAAGARITLRCPIIPGLNDYEGHFQMLGALAERLRGVEQIDVEPYHPLGISKSEAIGKSARHSDAKMPAAELGELWAGALRRHTAKPVVVS